MLRWALAEGGIRFDALRNPAAVALIEALLQHGGTLEIAEPKASEYDALPCFDDPAVSTAFEALGRAFYAFMSKPNRETNLKHFGALAAAVRRTRLDRDFSHSAGGPSGLDNVLSMPPLQVHEGCNFEFVILYCLQRMMLSLHPFGRLAVGDVANFQKVFFHSF